MPVLFHHDPIPDALRGAIVALGNFDGFHRGHQAVAAQAIRRARAEGRPAIIATFDPHPSAFFVPDAPPFRLTSLDQRAAHFAAAGADATLVFAFGPALAGLAAEDFVDDLLARRLGVGGVVTGEDFHFGAKRRGTPAMLAARGAAAGLTVDQVAAVMDGGAPISSSRIRAALITGDAREAARLMSRPFAIAGEVIHGDKRGRDLGWPTANLTLRDYQRPAYGVYAVRARGGDGVWRDGVANLGVRPMFDPPRELLEVHLFDFAGDLYGQTLEVALIERLRGEARFDGLNALVAQMNMDAAAARVALAF